ncbi:MAG: PAS domain-containing protein [Ginsengibacter sp.]
MNFQERNKAPDSTSLRIPPTDACLNKNGSDKNNMKAGEISQLHKLAFDNSLQANIITALSDGKIIEANNAACKLLGYAKKELLAKNRSAIFEIRENSFKKMLTKKITDNESTTLVSVKRKGGEKLTCEITSAIFMDDGIEKAITTIADMSQTILSQKNIDAKKEKLVADNIVLAKLKQKDIDIKKERIVADNIALAISKQKHIDTTKEKIVADNIVLAQAKSDTRLVENNEWIKYIAKASYDVMWDWDIVSGEIYVGDSIEEVFGYKVSNKTVKVKHFFRCLIPEEKNVVEKKLLKILASDKNTWNDSHRFRRHDGSVAFTTSRASIVRDENGKAVRLIGATQDVSRLQELEIKLEEQITNPEKDSEKFLLAAQLSLDVIWDWKILSNEIFIGEGFRELFGYMIQDNKGEVADWGNRLHPDDKEAVKKGFRDAIESSASLWQHAYRFTRADGSIANIFDRASIFRNAEGKAYRVIGVMQDTSLQKEKRVALPESANDKRSTLIEKIKNVIIDLIHHSNEQLQTNFSDYLSKTLEYDYTYLANLFSEVENIPIQKFIIAQKIELVKDLILNDELSITEIAVKLHYSSVAHLSNQFKKATGLTPTYFRQLRNQRNTVLENV